MVEDRKEFDESYVKKLREENASWRTKCRELEAQTHAAEVDSELVRQGLKADPSWVQIEEGQSVADAVKALAEQHPHLQSKVMPDVVSDLDFTPVARPMSVKPIQPSTQRSTTPKPATATRITTRNISEIKKDPVARAKVRDFYRDLLKSNSNQRET